MPNATKKFSSCVAANGVLMAVDGSYAPGGNGGWSVVCTKNGRLLWSAYGPVPRCKDIMDAEASALLEALSRVKEETLIVSDSRGLIMSASGKNNARNLPKRLVLAQAMVDAPAPFLLQWRPSRALEAQRLAHHLANAARVAHGLEEGVRQSKGNRRGNKRGRRMLPDPLTLMGEG